MRLSYSSNCFPNRVGGPSRRFPRLEGKRRVLLLTYGTRGDVQPLVALAQRLEASGHYEAFISTCDSFESFITKEGQVRFVSCGVSSVAQPDFLFDPVKAASFAQVLQVISDVYPALARGMWNATEKVKPDLILSQAVVRGIGAQCAEKLRIPNWTVHFAPSNTPTFDFPPPEYAQSNFGFLNKLKYTHRNLKIAQAAISSGLSKHDETFRRDVLCLPAPLDPMLLISDLDREPSIHAYSPVLQPKPKDWAAWHVVVGAMSLAPDSASVAKKVSLDADLEAFARQNKPVYIGFGSMEGASKQFQLAVDTVLNELDLPVIICSHADSAITKTNAKVKLITSAPHDSLFPLCSLVIHHGGAGTTNAAIAAGVPQIIFPILAWSDQPFWADVVQRLKVGFRCSLEDVTVFKHRVRFCVDGDGEIAERAQALRHAKHPDGASATVDIIDRYFDSLSQPFSN